MKTKIECETCDIQNNNIECVICHDNKYDNDKKQIITECCKQSFHMPCLSKWCDLNNSCPCCRKKNIAKEKILCKLCNYYINMKLGLLLNNNTDSEMINQLILDISLYHNIFH